jgi:putative lipoic acid-binding regulatory protein
MRIMDRERHEQAIRLLEATHAFPCPFMIKVIGRSEGGFLGRIVAAFRAAQDLDTDPPFRTRQTPDGRHIAVTFEPHVESAEEVLGIYESIRSVQGIVMIL